MTETNNLLNGITGVRVYEDEQKDIDEYEHFYTCACCGQAVDMRNLDQVFHHEKDGHNRHDINS